uniref:Chemokine interleukin-8-like domain-containing protein n=1 Tax=Gasterosteus aculeatus TaxID=69293 RepID=G3Q5S5_GASAC|nr:growth-regulated alpha protein-like [Gasterosteus aculeatus aculeatus]
MNTATRCIILLACAAICTSNSPILNCRCVKNSDAVSRHLIARIKQLPPRWYCNREELIAVLKDGREKCLAPNGRFAQAIKRYRTQRAMTRKTSTTGPKTTAA